MQGDNMIKSHSRGPSVIGLSTGEAEFYASVLGTAGMVKDLALSVYFFLSTHTQTCLH